MSDVMQALPKDSPIMKAWEAYKATTYFANSKRWAGTCTISSLGGRDDVQVIQQPATAY